MPDGLTIRKLTDTYYLDTITEWMYNWWGAKEAYSLEEVRCCMEHSLQENRLPQTYGLFLKDVLIGMYQFTNTDLFSRPDIYPWLANVYIDKKYRKKGYGTFLLSSIKQMATENSGANELYLFTEHEGLYEKFGWEFVAYIDTYLEPKFQRLYKMQIQ